MPGPVQQGKAPRVVLRHFGVEGFRVVLPEPVHTVDHEGHDGQNENLEYGRHDSADGSDDQPEQPDDFYHDCVLSDSLDRFDGVGEYCGDGCSQVVCQDGTQGRLLEGHQAVGVVGAEEQAAVEQQKQSDAKEVPDVPEHHLNITIDT